MFFFGGDVSDDTRNSLASVASIDDEGSFHSQRDAISNTAQQGTVTEEGTNTHPPYASPSGQTRLHNPSGSFTSRAVLPVFRLPSVHKGLRTRVLTRQRGETEKGVKLAWAGASPRSFEDTDRRQRTLAKPSLPHRTRNEIREFQGKAQRSGCEPTSYGLHNQGGGRKSGKRGERRTKASLSYRLRLPEGAGAYSNVYRTRSTPRCLRSKSNASPGELRQELSVAIRTVQDLTNRVRQDIANVHKLCPITNLRAQLYMQKWGIEMFERIFLKLKHGKLQSAFSQWQSWTTFSTQLELLHAVQRKEGANLVAKTTSQRNNGKQRRASCCTPL